LISGRRPASVLITVLAAAGLPLSASAQAPRLEADLGGSRIEYDTLSALDALSLAGLAEWQRSSLFARLTGGVTSFRDGGTSIQARGSLAAWVSPLGTASPLRLELGGGLGVSHHSSGFDVLVGRADARAHLVGKRYGGWVGAGLGAAENTYDSAAVWGVTPNAGAWWQGSRVRGSLSYSWLRVDGGSYPETDLAFTLTRGPLDLSVYAGTREWPYDPGAFDETWAGASAAVWVGRHAAITLSGGKYAADVLQGVSGGRFVSLGLRVSPRRVRPIPVQAVAPIVFTVAQASGGAIGFEVEGARRVEIAGDWNGWQPEPMATDARGRWLVPAGLAPGAYRFNLRVDGERWYVPEGVPTLDDGFGGTVGVLIVAGNDGGM
jgi:hypothetical protein